MSALEVLSDAAISLLREHRGVLDPRVSPCRHISDDGLLTCTVRVVVRTGVGVISVVVIILGMVHGKGIVARVV
jgi:hypothetical protein